MYPKSVMIMAFCNFVA